MHRPVGDALSSLIDSSSVVYSGFTATFYSLADVLQDVYTDTDWITPASTAGVLTANSAGRLPKAFFKDDLDYKVVLKTSGGATIATINPIFRAAGFLDSADLAPYLLKAGGTMTGALNLKEGLAIASASAIDLDAATGNMVHITGTTGISTVTLQDGATRTLVFDDVVTLTHSSNLLLGGANITTATGTVLHFVGEGSGVTRCTGGYSSTGKAIFESAELLVAVGDETTAITTGTAKISFRMPFAMTLDAIPRANLVTSQTSGSIVTIDINEAGTTILSTKLTIDNNETTSVTAATAAVLSDSSLADDAIITVDIDACDGSTTAAGLKILLRGYRRSS